jgi:hypothetical protein
MAPQSLTLNIPGLQREGAQLRLPNGGQGLTPTENVGGGLILRTAKTVTTQHAGLLTCHVWTHQHGKGLSLL